MKHFITILTSLLFTSTFFAQMPSPAKIENDLHLIYKKILTYPFEGNNGAWDSLETWNTSFREMLRNYTSMYPATLTFKFDSLRKDNITIISSKDGLFRIYSWDTWMGGTMHDFENVFQFRSDGQVDSKAVYDTATEGQGEYIPFYSQIFTLKANNNTYYLAVGNSVYSTKDAGQSIKIFSVANHILNDTVKLIKTKTGLMNSISFNFDFFSVAGRPERPVRLIKYDPVKKQILIPVVLENGTVTNRFIVYQFNGNYFEKKR